MSETCIKILINSLIFLARYRAHYFKKETFLSALNPLLYIYKNNQLDENNVKNGI